MPFHHGIADHLFRHINKNRIYKINYNYLPLRSLWKLERKDSNFSLFFLRISNTGLLLFGFATNTLFKINIKLK